MRKCRVHGVIVNLKLSGSDDCARFFNLAIAESDFRKVWIIKGADRDCDAFNIVRGRLPAVDKLYPEGHSTAPINVNHAMIVSDDVSAQLALCRIASHVQCRGGDPICPDRQPKRSDKAKRSYKTDKELPSVILSGLRSRVRSLPLSAQITIATVIAGAAWIAIARWFIGWIDDCYRQQDRYWILLGLFLFSLSSLWWWLGSAQNH